METAALQAGRDPATVSLLAVSKQQTADSVRGLAAAGQTEFGENYAQEALPKIAELRDLALAWHYIGQLQSNKTRPIAEQFDWVHTVDRERIAHRLNEQRPAHARRLEVLLQVRLDDNPAKGGVEPEELERLADATAGLPRLRLRGLMCLPEPTDDPIAQRAPFRRLRELLEALNQRGHRLDCLSMGMSGDLEAAVHEGATIVRVGTALFGARK